VLQEYLARNLSIYDIFASGETTDYYLVLVMFLAMLYLKLMHTDHSCIEKSDIENKHLIFENRFLTKMNTSGNQLLYQTDSQHTEVLWLT